MARQWVRQLHPQRVETDSVRDDRCAESCDRLRSLAARGRDPAEAVAGLVLHALHDRVADDPGGQSARVDRFAVGVPADPPGAAEDPVALFARPVRHAQGGPSVPCVECARADHSDFARRRYPESAEARDARGFSAVAMQIPLSPEAIRKRCHPMARRGTDCHPRRSQGFAATGCGRGGWDVCVQSFGNCG